MPAEWQYVVFPRPRSVSPLPVQPDHQLACNDTFVVLCACSERVEKKYAGLPAFVAPLFARLDRPRIQHDDKRPVHSPVKGQQDHLLGEYVALWICIIIYVHSMDQVGKEHCIVHACVFATGVGGYPEFGRSISAFFLGLDKNLQTRNSHHFNHKLQTFSVGAFPCSVDFKSLSHTVTRPMLDNRSSSFVLPVASNI